MTDGDIAIELKGISKKYVLNDAKITSLLSKEWKGHTTDVLSDIDLTVRKGEVVGLVGRNGCGKTTLMKLVAGMIDPTSGTMKVNGKMICIIESGTMFINDDTGYENIMYRGMLYGMSKKEIKAKMDSIVRYAELGDAVFKPVRTYSLGMRSRLGFAIMAHVDADIYILDEALNAGDSIFSGKAIKFINQLALKGKTVLLTSHSGTVLRDVCTRALLIEGGRIAAEGPYQVINAKYRRTMFTSINTIEEAAESDNPMVEYVLAKMKQSSEPMEYEILLRNAAEGRNVYAMVEYGDVLYDKGQYDEALGFYKMAAQAGDQDGRKRYSVLMTSSTAPILREIVTTYCEKGDHFDEYRMGMLLKELAVGTKMRINAYDTLNKAYQHGNLDAGYEVAVMKIVGNGTSLDNEGAIKILSDNAVKGHRNSARLLYDLYTDGQFMDPDPNEAFRWCEKAAMMGDPKSQFALAMMYRDGIGTEKDDERSKEWVHTYLRCLASPISNECAYAMKNSGIKTTMDEYKLYESGMGGYNDAATRLFMERMFLTRKEGDSEEIFETCNSYCNSAKNRGFLGKCYLEGIHVDCDEKKAFELYKTAADAGDAESMYILANLYKLGIGAEKDMGQYNRWIRMASRSGQINAMMITKETDAVAKDKIRHIKSKK